MHPGQSLVDAFVRVAAPTEESGIESFDPIAGVSVESSVCAW
jgi:hypothetical protein